MSSQQRSERRQRRVAARRAQILDAAARVFAEKGFHRATTREIAVAADVSEGTIYNYFDGKADLLIGIMARLAELDRLDVDMTGTPQGDVKGFFEAVFRERTSRIEQGQEMLQAVLPEMMVNPELRERFYQQYVLRIAKLVEQYLEARIERGDVRPVDVPLTVRALQSMFVGMLVLRILGDDVLQSRFGDVVRVVSSLVFDGLIPRNGE